MLKTERDYVAAQLASVNRMLATLPEDDFLGRMGFESRRQQLEHQLLEARTVPENRAQVALYFGGEPVIGSAGIEATFGTNVVWSFQDLLTKVWRAIDGGDVSHMGPIKDKDHAQLHITNVVHGSFGFVLEELADDTEPMFVTPLAKAAEQVAEYISTFTGENDATFSQMIEGLNSRVFQSMRTFFEHLHKSRATFRLVEHERDQQFDHLAIERAWYRAEASDVTEDRVEVRGKLLGVIPMKGRFELEPDAGHVIEGKVASKFGTSYLERIERERFAGQRWIAILHKRTVRKAGKDPIDSYTLLELQQIDEKK